MLKVSIPSRLFSLIIGIVSACSSFAYSQSPPFTLEFTKYDSSFTGYYFICPIKVGPPFNTPATHMILDDDGSIVYYRRFPLPQSTGDFKLHENGLMSYSHKGKWFLMDSTFTIVDSVSCGNGLTNDLHDILLLPNGNRVVLGMEEITMNLSSYNMFNQNGSPGSLAAVVKANVIQEQDVAGNVIFDWHAINHYDFEDVDEFFLNIPSNVDWTHANAVEIDDDGNFLLSLRHFNEITKIHRTTGAIMWRLGGKQNQFNFVNDPGAFLAQHDIRRMSNGNYSLFDNGRNTFPVHPAASKEYIVDTVSFSTILDWSYSANPAMHSSAMGSHRKTDSGFTITGYGMWNSNLAADMVNSQLDKISEIRFTDTLRTYRAFAYDTLPWSLPRPAISCFEQNGIYYLDAGTGHNSYTWNTGDTTQLVALSTTGSYQVFVPHGVGFAGSAIFTVSDLVDPCDLTSIKSPIQENNFTISPVPASDFIFISYKSKASGDMIIYNSAGLVVKTILVNNSETQRINISDLNKGVYVARINHQVIRFIKM